MTAVVTGASGHIGFNVAQQLIQLGYSVVLPARKENENLVKLKNLGASIEYVDLFLAESYVHLLSQADVLFHIAAENTTDIHDRNRIIANTFELTRAVMDTAVKSGIKTIVYTSSVVTLGRSRSNKVILDEHSSAFTWESPYVEGKIRAEQYCRELCRHADVDIRILYPSWAFGMGDIKGTPPHQLILKFLEKGELFTFDGGISIADVSDIAAAHVNAWKLGEKQGRYVLAGQNITFTQFYEMLATACNKGKPVFKVHRFFIIFGAHVLRILLGKKNPIDPGYAKSVVGRYSWYNSQKAVSALNYRIKSAVEIIEAGITQARALQSPAHKLFNRNNKLKAIDSLPG